MSEAGTLLSDLDNNAPGSDGDLVDSILSDLNQTSGTNQIIPQGNAPQQYAAAPPPPVGVRLPMQQAPPSIQSMHPNAADPAVATAHLIGRDHPTEADFQRMMMAAQGPLPYNTMVPQMQGIAPPQMQQQQPVYEEPKKNITGQFIDELKVPILVAIIVFVITLPAVNLLMSHYVPQLLRPGGDLNTLGMVTRALLAGLLFWVLQRVIAPLLSF
jgi:hypothetical protein